MGNERSTSEKKDFEKLLRLQVEPCEYFNDLQIHDILSEHRKEYFEKVGEWFKFWSLEPDKVDFPPKTILKTEGVKGDFRIMPCQIRYEGRNINSIKLVGTNEEEKVVKDKITVGKAFLYHPTDNFIAGIFDACVLSSVRTAVCAVSAFKHLSTERRSVGILGCGRIGYYTAMFLTLLDGVDEFVCYDNNPEAIENFLELTSEFDIQCKIVGSVKELIDQSSSLFISTYSRDPLVSKEDIEKGEIKFISSVGADCNSYSELHPTVASLPGKIYIDVWHSLKCGDLRSWLKEGTITEERMIELKDVISGKYTPDESGCRLFISTGFAFTDAISLDFIYQKRKNPESE